MKTFEDIQKQKYFTLTDEIIVNTVLEMKLNEIGELPSFHVIKESNEITPSEYTELREILDTYGDTKIRDIDEGIISKVLGGIAGFAVGPSIGKVIANALGVQRGIIYDMLTSRLVGAALGAAITKYIGGSR